MSVNAVPSARPRLRGPGAILVVLILAEVVSAFELSMMYVAVPTLIRDFHADAGTVAWVITAYLLVSSSSAALGGRLGDLFGRKRVLVVVLALAAVGSLVSLLGGSLAAVIIGRGIQGATGAVMALAFGLARAHLREDRVQVGLSMIGASALIAGSLGALAAGVVIDRFSWHAIFVCALILAGIGLVGAVVALPRDRPVLSRPRVDVLGAVLLPVAVTCLLLAISSVSSAGVFGARFLVPLVLALAIGAAWVVWELRVPEPIISIRMLANRHVGLTMLITFIAAIGPVGGSGMVQSLLMQYPAGSGVGLGLSAGAAGMVSAVTAVLGFAASPLGGLLARGAGARFTYALGVLLLTLPSLGMLLTWGNLPVYILLATVQAIGISLFYGALPNVLFEAVPPSRSSEATGTNTMIRNVGQSTATAVVAAILAAHTDQVSAMTTVAGFGTALVLLVVLGLVAFVLALLLRSHPVAWDPDGPAASAGDRGAPARTA